MRIFLVLFIGSVLSLSAESQVQDPYQKNLVDQLKNTPCSNQLREYVGAKLLRQGWVPEMITAPRARAAYGVSLRDTIAQKKYQIWSTKNSAHFAEINLATNQKGITSWDNKSACKASAIQLAQGPFKVLKAGFTDADLKRTLKSHPWGLIYVWTPYMPLSVEGIVKAKEVAKKKGAPITVLMDPAADPKEAQKWVSKKKVDPSEMRKVASVELASRNMNLHYPILFIYKKQFLSNRDFVGFKEVSTYSDWIDMESAQLDKELK